MRTKFFNLNKCLAAYLIASIALTSVAPANTFTDCVLSKIVWLVRMKQLPKDYFAKWKIKNKNSTFNDSIYQDAKLSDQDAIASGRAPSSPQSREEALALLSTLSASNGKTSSIDLGENWANLPGTTQLQTLKVLDQLVEGQTLFKTNPTWIKPVYHNQVVDLISQLEVLQYGDQTSMQALWGKSGTDWVEQAIKRKNENALETQSVLDVLEKNGTLTPGDKNSLVGCLRINPLYLRRLIGLAFGNLPKLDFMASIEADPSKILDPEIIQKLTIAGQKNFRYARARDVLQAVVLVAAMVKLKQHRDQQEEKRKEAEAAAEIEVQKKKAQIESGQKRVDDSIDKLNQDLLKLQNLK